MQLNFNEKLEIHNLKVGGKFEYDEKMKVPQTIWMEGAENIVFSDQRTTII